ATTHLLAGRFGGHGGPLARAPHRVRPTSADHRRRRQLPAAGLRTLGPGGARGRGRPVELPVHRLRRRHQPDHQPHGGFRRVRRAPLRGPVAARELVAVPHRDGLGGADREPARRAGQSAPSHARGSGGTVQRPHRPLERPQGGRAEPRGAPAERPRRARLPRRRVRHDLRVHHLPVPRVRRLEERARRRDLRAVAGRPGRPRQRGRGQHRPQHAGRHRLHRERLRHRQPPGDDAASQQVGRLREARHAGLHGGGQHRGLEHAELRRRPRGPERRGRVADRLAHLHPAADQSGGGQGGGQPQHDEVLRLGVQERRGCRAAARIHPPARSGPHRCPRRLERRQGARRPAGVERL
ncbi:MAG: Phosphate ABC transporter, periplasmic phosphate-binding protein PstS, partial [uncultured Acetobacteraceae bacterium]